MNMPDVIALLIGVLGLGVGLYQSLAARKAKKIHQDSCRIRCRDASNKTLRLGNNMVSLCKVLTRAEVMEPLVQMPSTARHFAAVHSSLGAILDVTEDFVRFCERLNEDHDNQFNENAIPEEEMEALREIRGCLIEVERSSDLHESITEQMGTNNSEAA